MQELQINREFFRRLFRPRWVQHLVFWLGYMTLFSSFHLSRGISEGEGLRVGMIELVHLSGLLAIVYFNLRILIPRFLNRQKYIQYVFILLAGTLLISISVNLIIDNLVPEMIRYRGGRRHRGPEFLTFVYMMIQFFFIALTSFLHYLKENFRLSEVDLQVKDLERRQLKAELDSLKAQINPHFLFNTLNNIYSHSLLKSEQAPDMILKLSALMNYIIYECRVDRISLHKEIDFIQNYIALEKVRIDESIRININIDIVENGHEIAPLMFVPFLENAFKHGVNIRQEQPHIDISLTALTENKINFTIENLMDSGDEPDMESKHGGIGLDNICKRLQLIYPDRHRIAIDTSDNKFRVELELDLD